MNTHRKPSQPQREHILANLVGGKDQPGAINRICASWDAAVEAAQSRGYASGHSLDAQSPPAAMDANHGEGRAIDYSDPTGDKGTRADRAERWLAEATGAIGLLLRISGAQALGERRWTGPFHPPSLRGTLREAARDLIEMWPLNADRLVDRLNGLANTAAKEWPPTPKAGEVIDGVKIGGRKNTSEVCVECGQTIGGNAADPLARIDGKPFHRKPCYNTVYVRTRRRAVNSAGTRQQ